MAIFDVLEKARRMAWVDEKGKAITLTFRPGVGKAKIDGIERELGVNLPLDFKELLAQCSGVDGLPIDIDFTGEEFSVGLEEIMPHSLPFASDGCGNHWCVDIQTTQESESTIYWFPHDPPTLLFQCKGVATFLEELIKTGKKGGGSALEAIQEDSFFNVWNKNPGVMTREEALQGGPLLAKFAESLGSEYVFIDLTDPEVGMGFSWGRFGPETDCKRFGDHRIFAYARPEKKPGLFKRLLGR